MSCRGKLWRVEPNLGNVRANYGVSGQITECGGKSCHVEANYVVSRQIMSCRGKLRRVEPNLGSVRANYVMLRQITSCRGKLCLVEANYVGVCWGKLRRVGANYGVSGKLRRVRQGTHRESI